MAGPSESDDDGGYVPHFFHDAFDVVSSGIKVAGKEGAKIAEHANPFVNAGFAAYDLNKMKEASDKGDQHGATVAGIDTAEDVASFIPPVGLALGAGNLASTFLTGESLAEHGANFMLSHGNDTPATTPSDGRTPADLGGNGAQGAPSSYPAGT